MIQIRDADDRGHFIHGWLDTCHMPSFGDCYDPNYRCPRSLRVMNEDRVASDKGFGAHRHQDMAIVTLPWSSGRGLDKCRSTQPTDLPSVGLEMKGCAYAKCDIDETGRQEHHWRQDRGLMALRAR